MYDTYAEAWITDGEAFATRPSFQGMAAIVWYRRKDYSDLSILFKTDVEFLQTYEVWLQCAEESESFCLSQGRAVMRIYLDPDTFVKWCADNGMAVDQHARLAYAAQMLQDECRN